MHIVIVSLPVIPKEIRITYHLENVVADESKEPKLVCEYKQQNFRRNMHVLILEEAEAKHEMPA